jgi:hypothetical protein
MKRFVNRKKVEERRKGVHVPPQDVQGRIDESLPGQGNPQQGLLAGSRLILVQIDIEMFKNHSEKVEVSKNLTCRARGLNLTHLRGFELTLRLKRGIHVNLPQT